MADTFNFDLDFEANDDGSFAVRVTSSEQPGETTFERPYTGGELERVIHQMGRTRTTRRYEDPAEAQARAFGKRLFDAAISGDVRDRFYEELSAAERAGGALRVRLRFDKALELANVPWEFLYVPDRQDYLALSANTPLVRRINTDDRFRRDLTVTPPLTVGLIISSPQEFAKLDVDQERRNVGKALEDLEEQGAIVVRAVPPTREGLLRSLDASPIHVLHFVGHGGFDEASGDGTLILEKPNGLADPLFGTELGWMVSGRPGLRMVVLNSCVGARSTATDPFAGVANALLLRNVPAVVAMQFEISDRAAVKFAERFYTAIANGVAVDIAVGRARQTLRLVERNLVEWATPVLYLQTDDARIFGPAAAPVVAAAAPAAQATEALPVDWDEDEVAAVTSAIREQLHDGDIGGAESSFQSAAIRIREHPDMLAIESELRDYRRASGTLRTARYLADAGQWADVLERVKTIEDDGIALPGLLELRNQADTAIRTMQRNVEAQTALAAARDAAGREDWQAVLDVLRPVVDDDYPPEGLDEISALVDTATTKLQVAAVGAKLRDAHGRGHWRAVVDAHEELAGLQVDHPKRLDEMAAQAQQRLEDASVKERLDAEYDAALTLLQNEEWTDALALLVSIDETRDDYRGAQHLKVTAQRNIDLGAAIDEARRATADADWGHALLALTPFIEDQDAYASLSRFGEAAELHARVLDEVGQKSAVQAAELQQALDHAKTARAEHEWSTVVDTLQPFADDAAYQDIDGRPEVLEFLGIATALHRIGSKREGKGDDLTRIHGIGPATSRKLKALGIVGYGQIAELTADETRIVAGEMGSRVTVARIQNEGWVAEADRLAKQAQEGKRDVRPSEAGNGWLLFSFRGRLSRSGWWQGFLLSLLVLAAGLLGVGGLSMLFGGTESTTTENLITYLVMAIFVWAVLALAVKRGHDCGRSGSSSIMLYLVVVGFFLSMGQEGTEGPNAYGARPLR